MSGADLHTLTGAYAAHALDADERAQFERHLAQCPACAREVAEFTATLARLGAAQAVAVPGELKSRVMGALDTVRQEAPRAAAGPDGARRPGRLARGWPRLALAACLAAAAALGGVAVQQHREADRARALAATLQRHQDQVTGLLTAPDARRASGPAAGGTGSGAVVWSHDKGRAVLLASGLPAPADGTAYELWFDDGAAMRPAGLMPRGDGAFLLDGPLDGARGIGVTVEPSAGSAHPTGAPVLLIPFT
ncbi:anti-sigma factor domain-containing protein [Kitasatospora sp. NBC_01300]|uniref:anti-sigma factor n=1 Tax=Kitasatospora sp. NBC_01300 TaxID=2903574 RepID=UPI00352C291F|nr:anti-sigma factor [Kitasatospora sp. NBC_01300]WSK08343.1 anti-sigma factor [Kitasatospora sp. NBC_01300]